MSKEKEKGGAIPTGTALAEAVDSTGIDQVRNAVSGLSRETVDKLTLELTETLHQIGLPLEDKVKASKILARNEQFMVIDATTISDYLDKRTGEVSDKHMFVLEFPDGSIEIIMQSDAPPRKRLVKLFATARALQRQAIAGPFKMTAKDVGQPQAALIFEQLPGFRARIL